MAHRKRSVEVKQARETQRFETGIHVGLLGLEECAHILEALDDVLHGGGVGLGQVPLSALCDVDAKGRDCDQGGGSRETEKVPGSHPCETENTPWHM